MKNSAYNQLVTDLSHNIVAQIAPQELPLFRAISEEYSKDPENTLKGQMGKDDDLGFGVAEAALFMTPIVFEVMKSVIKFLADEITKVVKEESPELISNSIKSMFKKFVPADTEDKQVLALTSAQLTQVRRLALEKARQLALNEDQAALLADSIVGSLTIAPL